VLEQTTSLTLIYTAALAGQLELLPRLFTRIEQERAAVNGPVILIDLGQACRAETWICEATQGRGMLVAMDAMGYDAFHIGPRDALYTRPELVEQIRQIILTPLAAGPWMAPVNRGKLKLLLVNALNLTQIAAAQDAQVDLIVGLRLGDSAQIEASWRDPHRLLLLDGGLIESGPLLGRLDITLVPEPPYIGIMNQAALLLSPDLIPNPTITGVVEFVQSEAYYAERKRGQM
jgi:hypothetical protein